MNRCCPKCLTPLDETGNCPLACNITYSFDPASSVPITNEIQYNYKCPVCYGEFLYPTVKQEESTGSLFTYRCPFCGKRMEGM